MSFLVNTCLAYSVSNFVGFDGLLLNLLSVRILDGG